MKTHYNFLIARNLEELDNLIESVNTDEDKIVAVTHSGGLYTVFYEMNGNRKEEPT